MKIEKVLADLAHLTDDAVLIAEAEPVSQPGPRIVWCNSAFERMTGYAADEVVGLSPRFLQGPDTDREGLRRIGDALREWRPVRQVLKNYRKDGSPFWVDISLKPVADESGRFHYWVAVERDVTEFKERELAAERALRERTALVDELSNARDQIERHAFHDQLTGLPNRRLLERRLYDLCAPEAPRSCGYVTFLHIDLDRFKQINDTLGHATGDKVLRVTSQRLCEILGGDAFVARIGGDEFMAVHHTDGTLDEAVRRAENVVDAICRPVEVEGHTCRIGASVGLAFGSCVGSDARELFVCADLALARAKRNGRNRVEVFTADLQEEVNRTKQTADEILAGLESGEFIAHFQPQVDARTHHVVGFEALARWRHPVRGLLSPFHFLDIAEDLGVLPEIDDAILRDAVALTQRLKALGLPLPRISVNVSQRRLRDPHLLEAVDAVHGACAPISFELVEAIFFDAADPVLERNVAALKAREIEIEIDDFGSGRASITGLMKVAPARLKIDRQLVMPIVDDPRQRRLVAAIIEMGKSLEISVTGEGVETMAHAEHLTNLGCDELQGYAFGRPMPAEDVETFMREQPGRAVA